MVRGDDFVEAGEAGFVEERTALAGRSGEEQDELAIAGESDVEPLAGSAAVGVGEDGCAFKDIGLLEIVGGHGDAPGGGAGVESGDLGGVAAQGERERFGNGFAGEVVFGGAETAHEDKNVDAGEGDADGVDEVLEAVANDGFEVDGDTNLIELFSEIEGVGVLTEGGEHLGADGDDFGFHRAAFSF